MTYRILPSALLLCLLCACNHDVETNGTSTLVVEGYIEDGSFPVVKVGRTIPLGTTPISTDDLYDYVDRWAKVTVSDGTDNVVLTGLRDSDYFPPFVYTTGNMRGVAGRTYTIKVESSEGETATATTTIPARAALDSFKVERLADNDTLVAVYAYTSYRKPSKVFTMIYGKQTEFLPAYMGVHDSTTIAEDGRISIRKGRNNLEGGSFTPYFNEGDTVTVQFSAIPDEAYDYWRKYEDMMNVSANPVFPTNVTLPGNVNGALGYWFGYGSNYYAVIARP